MLFFGGGLSKSEPVHWPSREKQISGKGFTFLWQIYGEPSPVSLSWWGEVVNTESLLVASLIQFFTPPLLTPRYPCLHKNHTVYRLRVNCLFQSNYIKQKKWFYLRFISELFMRCGFFLWKIWDHLKLSGRFS